MSTATIFHCVQCGNKLKPREEETMVCDACNAPEFQTTYFTANAEGGFGGPLVYIRWDSETKSVYVSKGGEERPQRDYSLRSCRAHVESGDWKQISEYEAKLLEK